MKRLLVIAAAMAATCAFAQERPNGGMPPRGPMMQHAGPWMVRMLSNKDALEKMGVTDDALKDKIVAALNPIKEEGDALEKKIREISREQAEMTRGLFDDKTRDPKPVMDKITEVAKLRAEQGRLSVKAFLVLRDNLPQEQLEKAKNFIFSHGAERGRMRRGGGDGHGPRRGMRGGDGDQGERRGPPHGRRGKKATE